MESEIITFNEPKAPASEVFRTLRTNIQFMSTNKNIKLLLVTSTMPGEGKSWVVSNLAVTFAQSEKRVVIVDTDMRRGRQAKLFKKDVEPGLSNYLSGIYGDGKAFDGDLDKCIQETEMKGLYIISAGSIPPNPSELLASEKMNTLMQELKNKFDIVILDGTPSSIVTDSVILSKDADATLIVAAYKKAKTEDLKRLKKEIENVGGNVIGITLNRISKTEHRYHSGYYYYYYYSDDEMKKKKKKKDNKGNKKDK